MHDAGNFTPSGFGSNTGLGVRALRSNTTGSFNTATGTSALEGNTTGLANTATGSGALQNNTTGSNNTATGNAALFNNTTGDNNTAVGKAALFRNTTATFNTAIGPSALESNTTGEDNTAIGPSALLSNVTGNNNTALGNIALSGNTTGSNYTALGFQAGTNATTGDDNIYIAHPGVAAEAATTRIGTAGTQIRTFIAGVTGVNVGAQPAVLVNGFGQLGVNLSSARFKEAIEPMGEASQGLRRLRPVTFRYRQAAADGTRPHQYGLIAEEVAEVYPDLVAYTADGQPETVLYHVLPALLLNELQELHRELATKTRTLETQGRLLEEMRRRLEALEGGVGR